MRRVQITFICLLLMVFCLGCTGIQEKWDLLTPDEKARVVIGDIQDQLDIMFDQAKIYFDAHPEHESVWVNDIVPAFKVANETIADVMALAQAEEITPQLVYSRISPFIAKIVNLVAKYGLIL